MDPTQVLLDLRKAIARRDWLTADLLFAGLDEWLTKGSSLPGPWKSAR
jgi:hypothetical protein